MKRSSMASRFLGLPVALAALSGAVLQGQTTIPSNNALPISAADTSKPGFVWRVHQVATGQPNTNQRGEDQLAGLLGDNIAQVGQQGIAIAPGTAGATSKDPISFDIAGVLNLDQSAAGGGNFTPNDQMPGIDPAGNTDNIAAEALTWLELPAGVISMGVNSDDGFKVTLGGASPSDKFAIMPAGATFDGGRGAGDSIFTFTITQPGLYAARCLWYEGGGGAEVEWFTVKPDGTKVLINDVANGGIKAYRGVTTGAKAYARRTLPSAGDTAAAPNTPVLVELVEGATAISAATVKLRIDGTDTGAVATKAGNVITASYTPSILFAPASDHTASVVYTEGANVVTQSWTFRVQNYKTIPRTAKVNPNTSKPGFKWNVFANAGNQANTLSRTEDALNGRLKDANGNLIANNADPAAQGVAIAPGTGPTPAAHDLVRFEIATVINLSQTGGESNGNFPNDDQMPGIPATDQSTDGVAAEVITFVELPAGTITMGVNSDDGFRLYGGNYLDAFSRQNLGEFDGGRGAADTIFSFVIQEAGVYPFRLIWEEGGGGANVEWFVVKADGSKVLVGDTAAGGPKAYREAIGGTPVYISSVSPEPAPRQLNGTSRTLSIVLNDGTTTTVDDNSVTVTYDGAQVPLTKNRQGSRLTVTYAPTGIQFPSEQHTASITFKDNTGSVNRTETWQFRNMKNVILTGTPVASENFDSYPEGTQPTGWVAVNWTANCDPGPDITNQRSDTYKDWVVISQDTVLLVDDAGFPKAGDPSAPYVTVNANETINGVAVTPEQLMSGNVLYAESDSRCNADALSLAREGQTQFITTKAFNMTTVTNPVLVFSSIYMQNQDSYGGVEYSVDGGTTWLPVMYFLDTPDIVLNGDGTVNAVATFTNPNTDTSSWTDNGVAKGDKYGDGLAAPITAALGDYIVPRINDDSTEGHRIEIARLPAASKKADVRLRLSAMGTDSWYFAVDNIAFYDIAPATPTAAPKITSATVSGGFITIKWDNGGTLQSSGALGSTANWTSTGNSTGTFSEAATGTKFYRVVR